MNNSLNICLFSSRTDSIGKNTTMTWTELKEKISYPIITQETQVEFTKLKKARQDEIKDVGGFVGGYLKNGKRSKLTVENRSLIALDADYAGEDFKDRLKDRFKEYAFILYPTHKSKAGNRRYRVLFPLSRPISPEEYEPLARWITSTIGIEDFDPTTYQFERLMFWPSISQDAEYDYTDSDGSFLNPDTILSLAYPDWTDLTCWPRSKREDLTIKKTYAKAQKAANPLKKRGIVGSFCRAYSVTEALEEFLEDEYSPTDHPTRFTYSGGSTSGGLVIYDDCFAYSHHATDPISMQLVNAFDLVRIHKFGDLDESAAENTPTSSLPSFKRMGEFAASLAKVRIEIANNNNSALDDFADELKGSSEDGEAKKDDDWKGKLEVNPVTNKFLGSIQNIKLILSHDPAFKGKLVTDLMANRPMKIAPMPWDKKDLMRDMVWRDSDDAILRNYMEEHYGIRSRASIADALSEVFHTNSFHPVRDYFNSLQWDGTPRLETLFCRYLGAEDNPYVRAVTRKAFTACVARVMEPACKFDYMPLLYGPQGLGKSLLLNIMGGEWFSDTLTNIGSKESYEAVDGSLIVEMAEMAATKRADVEAIKQYISKRTDKYRRAYDRRVTDNPRQCVFFGTTNEEQCLNDYTGNRRFWVIETTKGKQNVSKELPLERDQLWAEAVAYYQAGEPLFLSSELEQEAQRVQSLHTFEPAKWADIRTFLARKLPKEWEEMSSNAHQDWLAENSDEDGEIEREAVSAKEIWVECFGGTSRKWDNRDLREILNCLQNEGWIHDKKVTRTRLYGTQRLFRRPKK